ncbi:MAG: DUF5671 domain-containing protein [Patescibacteria group bacterium]|jgi:hypothetical protein
MNKSTPRDVFAHLLAVVTLIISVVSFIVLLFQFIDVYFPDALEFYRSRRVVGSVMQGAIAALVVAWPVYLYVLRLLGKDVEADPEKREIRVRRWLFNFTLFVAAVTIIIDLIVLIRSFLGGELTTRFGLKILVVLAVAALVFWYYLSDLKREAGVTDKFSRPLAYGLSALVIAAVVSGFFLAGSPATQRAWRFDDQRVSDLQTAQGQVVDYWVAKNTLPKTLEDLTSSLTGYTVPVDPETGVPYEYKVLADLQFELCAVFSSAFSEQVGKTMPSIPTRIENANWDHSAGRVCFARTIDPELQRPDNIFPPKLIGPPVQR